MFFKKKLPETRLYGKRVKLVPITTHLNSFIHTCHRDIFNIASGEELKHKGSSLKPNLKYVFTSIITNRLLNTRESPTELCRTFFSKFIPNDIPYNISDDVAKIIVSIADKVCDENTILNNHGRVIGNYLDPEFIREERTAIYIKGDMLHFFYTVNLFPYVTRSVIASNVRDDVYKLIKSKKLLIIRHLFANLPLSKIRLGYRLISALLENRVMTMSTGELAMIKKLSEYQVKILEETIVELEQKLK